MKSILISTEKKQFFLSRIISLFYSNQISFTARNKISEEIKTLKEYHQVGHSSSIAGDILFQKYFKSIHNSPLFNYLDKDFLIHNFKRTLNFKIEVILRNNSLVKKILTQYNVNNPYYIIPDADLDLSILNKLKKNNIIDSNFKIQSIIKYNYLIKDFLKTIYSIFFIIFYPISKFSPRYLTNIKISKKSFDFCGLLTSGVTFQNYPFSIDFFKHSINDKSKLGFIIPEQTLDLSDQKFLHQNYTLINFFCDSFFKTTFKEKLSLYSLEFSKLQFKLLLFSLKYPFFAREASLILKNYFNWNLFFKKYNCSRFYCIQHPFDLTTHFMIRKFGAKSYFVYHGSTTNRILKENEKIAEEIYYSHLIFDGYIGPKATGEWFKENENNFFKYYGIGTICSDFIDLYRKSNAQKVFKYKYNIPEHKVIISAFDQTTGASGIYTYLECFNFYKTLFEISLIQKDWIFILKPKKQSTINELIKQFPMFSMFIDHPSFLWSGIFELGVYDSIGFSDVMLASPISSVLVESWIANVPGIIFDAAGKYREEFLYLESIPEIYSSEKYDLETKILYWLNATDEIKQAFRQEKIVSVYCEGNGTNLVEKFLTIISE
jgi:hypothetical protein